MQKLAISAIAKVAKPEPAIVDVTVILIDGTIALLRLNAVEARTLFRQLALLTLSAFLVCGLHIRWRRTMTGPRPAERRWTLVEEKQLLEMLEAGKTAVEVSRQIKRTPGAIYTRMQKIYRRRRAPSNATS